MNCTLVNLIVLSGVGLAWGGEAVQNGLDVNSPRNLTVTPLLAAVASLDEGRVRELLQAGATPDDPLAGRSPLIQAITSFDPAKGRELFCSARIVQALLEHGADPNRPDPAIGSLPLESAFGVGDLKVTVRSGPH